MQQPRSVYWSSSTVNVKFRCQNWRIKERGDLSRQAILYRLSVIKSEYNAAPRHVCLLNLDLENLSCSVYLSRLEVFIFSYKMHNSLGTSCQLCVSVVWCEAGTLQSVGLSEWVHEWKQPTAAVENEVGREWWEWIKTIKLQANTHNWRHFNIWVIIL